MKEPKDRLIDFLLIVVIGLIGFGVGQICASIKNNSHQNVLLWQKKADKEDVNSEHQKLWKEIDKIRNAIHE